MSGKVGVVGAGAVGRAFLERLARAGFATASYDPAPASLAALGSIATSVVESPAAAARDAGIVHVCVRSDDQALDATLGERGILTTLRAGATIVVHSTVQPATTRRIGSAAAARGVEVVDAPVIGVPDVIRAGSACLLAGGAVATVDALRPHLAHLARAVYYLGPLGSGNVAKIAKNLATAADRVVLGEVVALATAGGLDPRAMLDLMHDEFEPAARRWPKAFRVEAGHAVALPTTNLLDKDIRLAAELAAAYGLDLTVTRSVAETAARWVTTWQNGNEVEL